ncbi:hypothetical protein RND81_10G243400 [Saponaria officinalis]|uniref:Fe2OG dioxygenase domain-containing protein n=1 Tax=Saponaria officinalis TaxID=3572 RepID=A0AAW1I814_SAPOF
MGSSSFNYSNFINNLNHPKMSREEKLNELEKTKAGVKGLVDSGIKKVPNIFISPNVQQNESTDQTCQTDKKIPVIDLRGIENEQQRGQIVNELLEASKKWGMFQLLNHGLPAETIHAMLDCVQKFNEQPVELKSEFYTRDEGRKVQYRLSLHRVTQTAFWKDTITCRFEGPDDLQACPAVCRKPMSEYLKYMIKLKDTVSELLSEALGLNSNHLKMMQCLDSQKLNCHYYPACPEPSLVMGTPKHSDPYFFTVLVHNDIDGLQVLHENQWIDVKPVEGAVIANIGDMLQVYMLIH